MIREYNIRYITTTITIHIEDHMGTYTDNKLANQFARSAVIGP
jgi:hypothetical protein